MRHGGFGNHKCLSGILPFHYTKKEGKMMHKKPHNILFILNDQERYINRSKYCDFDDALPGRKRLQKRGMTFTNHRINSSVCTSSRSVIYTGQHIQHTGMFDNLGYYWSNDLSPDSIPTLGDLVKRADYYAAYKGKWHLCEALEEDSLYKNLPSEEYTKAMEDYGFHDYVGIGDIIGTTWGGYFNDETIGELARRWLRMKGQPLDLQHKPWFKAVNLVNPHDAMFFNTDPCNTNWPDRDSQQNPKPLMSIARAPKSTLYDRTWNEIPLPASWNHPSKRLDAHNNYDMCKGVINGVIRNEKDRWRRLQNYYLNCICHTDRVVVGILDALDELGLTENTIIVMASDHGELGGAHGLSGKGSTAFEEQVHVPLIISHPDYPETHGFGCNAVTSHLDLAPTFANWAGQHVNKEHPEITHELRARGLPGKDLTPLLEKGHHGVNALHEDGVLYCFNMYSYLDGNFAKEAQDYANTHCGTTEGFEGKIDLSLRGAIRSVFDGRYKYSRYFSPKEHNLPWTVDEVYAKNDVELFDLECDPNEVHNLARTQEDLTDETEELLLTMNEKMNKLIRYEVGMDDGSCLPPLEGPVKLMAEKPFDP
jgi:arylsulfatase A-like enzyme